ncbi:hypothetical protein SAEN8230_21455 [Salmonella enterica subsp. arizonae]
MCIHCYRQRGGLTYVPGFIRHRHTQSVTAVRPVAIRRKTPPPSFLTRIKYTCRTIMRHAYHNASDVGINMLQDKIRLGTVGQVITPFTGIIRVVQRDGWH